MSYNLLIEGDVDFEEWAAVAGRFSMFELFPAANHVTAGLGVAIPLASVKAAPALVRVQLERLRAEIERAGVDAWDLVRGLQLTSASDWLGMTDALLR